MPLIPNAPLRINLATLGAPESHVDMIHPRNVPHGQIMKAAKLQTVEEASAFTHSLITGWHIEMQQPDGTTAELPFSPSDPACLDPVPEAVLNYVTEQWKLASEPSKR